MPTNPRDKSPGRRGPANTRRASGRRRAADPTPLSRPAIVQAALSLVADVGVGGFSARKLGERLGCEALSIYHHFPSKQHLLDALVDEVVGGLEWPAPELPPLERLRGAMHAYRAMAHRHPAFFPYVAVHRLNTPAGVAFIEKILAIVQAVVPDAEMAARHFRTLGYYLVGAALDETAGYAKGPSAAEPVDGAFIARECPRLAQAAHWFQRSEWDATFEAGVQAMLQAMARDAAT
jgi:AcrR family transcriptional regulator